MICWCGLASHPVPVTLVEQRGDQISEEGGGWDTLQASGLRSASSSPGIQELESQANRACLFPSCSGLDDVIFSYVLGVLGDLGPSGPSEENFDMEAFTEMMEAYVPGFAHIPRGTIGDMIQKLSGQLSGARNKEPL